jgi:hypothetical protein
VKPATLRQSGYKMSTISVSFHIGYDELVAAVASLWGEDDIELHVSKGRIEATLRERLHNGGVDGLVYWSDDIDPDEAAKIKEWAEGQVKRFWPDLFARTVPASMSATPRH